MPAVVRKWNFHFHLVFCISSSTTFKNLLLFLSGSFTSSNLIFTQILFHLLFLLSDLITTHILHGDSVIGPNRSACRSPWQQLAPIPEVVPLPPETPLPLLLNGSFSCTLSKCIRTQWKSF